MRMEADEPLEARGENRLSQCVGVRGFSSGNGTAATSKRTRQAGHQSDDDDGMRTPTRGEDRNGVICYQRRRCWATPGYAHGSTVSMLNEVGDGEGCS